MKSLIFLLAFLALTAGVPSASAVEVGLDTVLVGNPGIVAGDDFANGVFDVPPWYVVSGAPGPEAGETLQMHGGDFIYLGLNTDPFATTLAYSQMQLTDFPAGSSASMILFGVQPGEMLSLSVIPGKAMLSDGIGATLGSVPLPLSSEVTLQLTIVPLGHVTASVNGFSVFDEKLEFSEVTGLGIQVVPEPATLGLLGLGCLFMGVRRRWQRRPSLPS